MAFRCKSWVPALADNPLWLFRADLVWISSGLLTEGFVVGKRYFRMISYIFVRHLWAIRRGVIWLFSCEIFSFTDYQRWSGCLGHLVPQELSCPDLHFSGLFHDHSFPEVLLFFRENILPTIWKIRNVRILASTDCIISEFNLRVCIGSVWLQGSIS